MNIIVTGGLGNVGTVLCQTLLAQGHSVLIIDDLSNGGGMIPGHSNAFFDHPACAITAVDVGDAHALSELHHEIRAVFGAFPVHEIYHLASICSPPKYLASPFECIATNTITTDKLCQIAHLNNAKILFTSTSEVYGNPMVHPQPETYNGNVNPTSPRSVYDEAKRLGETIMMTHHRTVGTRTRIARLFNTYGPYMHPSDGRVVSNFITQALLNKPLTIYGDGTQTRSLCYVADVVDGLIRLMAHDDPTPVNLGSTDEITVKQLADAVLALIPDSTSTIEIIPKLLPIDDPERRRPDITKANTLLHWSPSTPLSVGLSHVIDHYRTLTLA